MRDQVKKDIESLQRECDELRNQLNSLPMYVDWKERLLEHKRDLEQQIAEEDE